MVSTRDIQSYCDAIAAAFKPQRIILFGSHAYGKPDDGSDVDVLVIMRNSKRLGHRPAVTIRTAIKASFPVDLLVREEREVSRRVKERDLFMLDVTEKGRVMYETVHA